MESGVNFFYFQILEILQDFGVDFSKDKIFSRSPNFFAPCLNIGIYLISEDVFQCLISRLNFYCLLFPSLCVHFYGTFCNFMRNISQLFPRHFPNNSETFSSIFLSIFPNIFRLILRKNPTKILNISA